MANIMDMKTIMNKPSRNGFDLSTKRNFTAKCGELLPVLTQEVLPDDNFTIDLRAFTRTAPVNTAAFARIREYYDFYYVPYHLLWNRANEVLSQMDFNQQHATSLSEMPSPFSGELPYITSNQIAEYLYRLDQYRTDNTRFNFFSYSRPKLTIKLLEYLQYGNYEFALDAPDANSKRYNVDLNIMSLLAYQKIYSDYFRNQQWEKPNPSTFNCDYMNGSSSMNVNIPTSVDDGFYQNYNFFDLRYCDWPKDLYHGVLPSPQYGDTAVVPLSGSSDAPFNLEGQLTTNGLTNFALRHMGGGDAGSISLTGEPVSGKNILANYYLDFARISPRTGSSSVNLSLENVTTTQAFGEGISILALRQYEFLQKWKEIAQCGDQDYKGITKRIWGADVPAGLSDKCQYLGGIASSLDINEVVNNNITGDYGASIAGKGVGVSDGKITFKSDGQYGVIMCIYHCMPLVDYTVDYVSPSNTRVNAEDFANPVFDRVGMQGVSSVSLLTNYDAQSTNVPKEPFMLGYAPRYIDYKTNIDLSFGAFKRDLKNWVLSYDALSIVRSMTGDALGDGTDLQYPSPTSPTIPQPNYVFFKVNPNLVDPIFALKADSEMNTDQFWCSSYFDIKVVRNLDVDGLPY